MTRSTARVLLIGGMMAVLVVGGLLVYGRLRPRPASTRGDPAVLVALAITALERGGQALSREQVSAVLPLLRVLRDTDPRDEEVSRALARQILEVLTAEQRREIQRLQRERRRRQDGGAGQGPDEPRGRGEPGRLGGLAARRPIVGPSAAEVRRRVLDRLIARLEQRR